MGMVDLSIIVPAYNVGGRIARTLGSIFAQKTKYSYEVICIDGPSTDNTREVVESFASEHPNLRPINYEEKNLLGARRLGVLNAKGRYITFCDGDDCEASNAVETMVSTLDKTGADMINTGFYFVKKGGTRPTFFRKDEVYDRTGLYKALLRDTYVRSYLWCKAFKRELFDEGSFIVLDRNIYREDVLFNFLAARKVRRAVTVKAPTYYYDKTGESGFSPASKGRVMDFIRVLAFERYVIERLEDDELLHFFRHMRLRRYLQVRFDLLFNKKAFSKKEYGKAKRYIRSYLKLLTKKGKMPIEDEPWAEFIHAFEGTK